MRITVCEMPDGVVEREGASEVGAEAARPMAPVRVSSWGRRPNLERTATDGLASDLLAEASYLNAALPRADPEIVRGPRRQPRVVGGYAWS